MANDTAIASGIHGQPRRELYRRGRRLLSSMIERNWRGSRSALEAAVRRFLRDKPGAFLARLVNDRAFAVAAAASLIAAGAAGALPPVNLSDIVAGNGGFVINGIDQGDWAGFNVSGAGDVNGDGFDDLIIGAHLADPAGINYAGESYVVFGKPDGTAVSLAAVAAGIGGFVINGIDPNDQSGNGVSGAGDVNGDGLDDLIVGARNADPAGHSQAGESYVVFGKRDGIAVNLSAVVAGVGGFVINGIDPVDYSGRRVSGAGDVNGDGLDDLIVGAHAADPAGNSGAGESYVVFGKGDGAPVNLSAVVAGIGGFVINGIDFVDQSGFDVSGAGDVNGDGLADLIVGARNAEPVGLFNDAGESYVVFGKTDGAAVNLSAVVAGAGGFVINGIDRGDRSGWSVSGAGDVSGDGLADVIVGAPYADAARPFSSAGESYVVFGKSDGAAVNLSAVAAGSGGFVIYGSDAYDQSGFCVSGAGDVNGDGLADVIVGAPYASPAGNVWAGESYVVVGRPDGTAVNLAAVATGNGGFVINGVDAYDHSGRSVSGAGDVNGDGFDDVIVGAFIANGAFGESYVIFGKCGPVMPGDVDRDRDVDGADLGVLFRAWGPCSCCPADLNGDGVVDGDDLGQLLGAWTG